MSQPSPKRQIEFLSNLQRLLSEGSFVATYKFALLSSLADLCVEKGEDTGAELDLSTREIAHKFIAFYWRQSRPFLPKGKVGAAIILRQNTGREADVIRLLREQSQAGAKSLTSLQQNKRMWNKITSQVDRVVREMPLWKLQTVGKSKLEFLYSNAMEGTAIRLKPGVMFCFRAFHIFITDMVRGAWIRHIRRYNQDRLGNPVDLDEFLFGSERISLAAYVPILREVQSSSCFYCRREIRQATVQIDHFIPWTTYPINLGHNFVLADSTCNAAKSDHLAAQQHLERWSSRNRDLGSELSARFDQVGIIHDVHASQTIAEWAYNRAFVSHAETFRARGVFEQLSAEWRQSLNCG